MSNQSGKMPNTSAERLVHERARTPLTRPPALRPGHRTHVIVRDDRAPNAQEATARAATMPWWPRVTRRVPWATGRYWVFHVKDKANGK